MAISGSAQKTNALSFSSEHIRIFNDINCCLFAIDENNDVTTCIVRANERGEILFV